MDATPHPYEHEHEQYSGIGGDGDGAPRPHMVSNTADLKNKIERFTAIDALVRAISSRGNDTAKAQACTDLAGKIEIGKNGLKEDKFFKMISSQEFAVLAAAAKSAGQTYPQFTDIARRQLTVRNDAATDKDVRVISDMAQKLLALSLTDFTQADTELYDRYRASSSSRPSYERDGGSDNYQTITDAVRQWNSAKELLGSGGVKGKAERDKLAKLVDAGGSEAAELTSKLRELSSNFMTHYNAVQPFMGKGGGSSRTSRTPSENGLEAGEATAQLQEAGKLLDELASRAQDALANLASSDEFDPRRVTFEDFLRYSEGGGRATTTAAGKPPPPPLITAEQAELVRNKLTTTHLYQTLGMALAMSVGDMRALIADYLRAASSYESGRGSSGSGSGSSQAFAQQKAAVQSLDQVLGQCESQLSFPTGGGPPAVLRDAAQKLGAQVVHDALDQGKGNKVASASGSGSGSGSGSSGAWGALAFSSGSSSGSASQQGMGQGGGLPGLGFLFRRVDAERVGRHLDQLERFQAEAADANTGMFVATQANRLAETVLDLERQARAIGGGGGGLDDAGVSTGASEGEMALRVRALGKQKMAAAKTFAHGVRASAAAYATMHLRFVAERHGEAMRYMRYWDDLVRANAKDEKALQAMGLDEAVRGAIKEHKGLVARLVKDAREVLADKVRRKVTEAQRTSLASSGEPRLDDAQQAEVDRRLDQLSEWLVDRSERVEDTYLRGSLTLIESVTDPTTLMLYALKAVRLAIASAALNVAAGTFTAMYVRCVYTLDVPPPNPAVMVALALGLDAALSAIVLLVLYTAMRIFKAPDNDFPVDSALLWAWAHDYFAATLAVGALSLIVGEVVRSKKYFRFKYEGERGIRAMREMMWYVYCVLLPIPFYRLLSF